jgi:Ca2+/Na+ antiporter
MKLKFYIFLFLLSSAIFAQQKQVETSIDTTKNKIGAEFKLTLKTVVSSKSKVVFPKQKTFGRLEVIQSYPIDTVKKNDTYELIKKYGLTQFDSGKYVIPSVTILIDKKPYLSDSIRVEVANVKVDTLQQKMYDIKDISGDENGIGDWWKYVLGLVIILAIGAFVYWFVKKRQQKKIEEEVYKTPIEKATSLMNNLEKKELVQKGEIKEYYSELTDIARNYIEEAIHIPAMESTTSELILAIKSASTKKKMALTPETVENLERVLRQADLVKFAKSKPLDFEITEDRNKIQRVILTLDNAIPTEVETEEDQVLNEAQRQKQIKIQLRKRRNQRIAIAAASVLGLIILTASYFIATKGFVYVKDTVLMNSSKTLLEGEWVKSEYGNPSVIIETPEVLKRMDVKKILPKTGFAFIKDMNVFALGNLTDEFSVSVGTYKVKQEMKKDNFEEADKLGLQLLEGLNFQNIILKKEEFQTKEGVVGAKLFGGLSKIDPLTKTTHKFYYELLFFQEDGGVEQILILHKEGDTYAQQMSERIISSVEFKKGNN